VPSHRASAPARNRAPAPGQAQPVQKTRRICAHRRRRNRRSRPERRFDHEERPGARGTHTSRHSTSRRGAAETRDLVVASSARENPVDRRQHLAVLVRFVVVGRHLVVEVERDGGALREAEGALPAARHQRARRRIDAAEEHLQTARAARAAGRKARAARVCGVVGIGERIVGIGEAVGAGVEVGTQDRRRATADLERHHFDEVDLVVDGPVAIRYGEPPVADGDHFRAMQPRRAGDGRVGENRRTLDERVVERVGSGVARGERRLPVRLFRRRRRPIAMLRCHRLAGRSRSDPPRQSQCRLGHSVGCATSRPTARSSTAGRKKSPSALESSDHLSAGLLVALERSADALAACAGGRPTCGIRAPLPSYR
jgi:hypothetical protein